jgi:hypothetical protein
VSFHIRGSSAIKDEGSEIASLHVRGLQQDVRDEIFSPGSPCRPSHYLCIMDSPCSCTKLLFPLCLSATRDATQRGPRTGRTIICRWHITSHERHMSRPNFLSTNSVLITKGASTIEQTTSCFHQQDYLPILSLLLRRMSDLSRIHQQWLHTSRKMPTRATTDICMQCNQTSPESHLHLTQPVQPAQQSSDTSTAADSAVSFF